VLVDRSGSPRTAKALSTKSRSGVRPVGGFDREGPGVVFLVGPDGLLASVSRAALQSALDAAMTEHLGHEKGERTGAGKGNHRNGTSPKSVRTEVGPVEFRRARDRQGSFEPHIVRKHARGVAGFDEAIISLYAQV
jgi:putative transposase